MIDTYIKQNYGVCAKEPCGCRRNNGNVILCPNWQPMSCSNWDEMLEEAQKLYRKVKENET